MSERVAAGRTGLTEEIDFQGKKKVRSLAEQIFHLMAQQGVMYGLDTPIRQSLENLADYFLEQGLAKSRKKVVDLIEEAVEANEHVFAREERDDSVVYMTTRRGRPQAAQPGPSLPPRHRHKAPEGASPTPRRRVVRRPPLAPFWVRTVVRQMKPVRPPTPEPTPTPAPVAEEAPVVEEAAAPAAPAEAPAVTELVLPDGTVIDFAKQVPELLTEHGQAIANRLYEALERDFRLASFGGLWYHEDLLEHFSKGRLNEIRRYILEEETPLSDETILGDLFFKNPRDSDYALWSFSLNARLLKEKKDFEYVGVPGTNLWSVKGLPSIGTDEMKASEIGQDYDYLLEEQPEEITEFPLQLEHFLTFYEYRYGVLPFDAQAQAFFPPPLLEGQRSAQLRFEMPQHYEAYTVELRYPSGNRGGWLWGLEEFFHSSLVPGAFIVISRTEEPNVFVLQYLVTDAQENRLMVYNARKDRYTFDEILYYCETEAAMLLNEDRFPGLRNSRSLPPSKRKRPTDVVAHAFTLIGEEQDGQYVASLEDLFPVVNIERPFSRSFLTKVLDETDVFEAFDEEGALFAYTPDEE